MTPSPSHRASRLTRLLLFGAAYLWPLAEPPALTSTFGEFRSHHFHGGIDLSTGRRNGLPVRAVYDGSVVRVRASGVGYGRSIYQQLDDGRLAVYAHLDDWAPSLAAYVESVQAASGNYEQDLWPEPGRFRFRRGDVIGWAGETGAGPSHLHLELREGDTGLNPLRHGLGTPDGVAPILRALWVHPAGPASRVEGGFEPRRFEAAAAGGGRYRIARPIRVTGPVRVALEGFDRTEARTTPLALYDLRATLDGDTVYHGRLDFLPWGETREVKVVFDPVARAHGARRSYALTPPDGLRSGAVRRSFARWLAPPGEHPVRIDAEDAAGNAAVLEATMQWSDPAARPAASAGGASERLDLELRGGAAVVRGPAGGGRSVGWRLEPARGPAREGTGGGITILDPDLAPGSTALWTVAILAPGADGATRDTVEVRRLGLGAIDPAHATTIRTPDGAFTLSLEADEVFEPAWVAVERRGEAPSFGWGETLTPRYQVLPGGSLPLRGTASLRLALPDGAGPRAGLFEVSGGGADFVGGLLEAGGPAVGGGVRTLGAFAAMTDTVAPVLERGRIRRPRRAGVGRPVFEARWRVTDRGSGISAAGVELEVDGRRVPVEYAPDVRSAIWKPRATPSPGDHPYRLRVTDRLGNRSERTGTLRVR